ncbi:MAG: HAMP domain-containing histidine kinase [Oscillospiraceae bacterium]|nr:HAMP domain-containing histidine kinase [Oscillospiraceae bacterium]
MISFNRIILMVMLLFALLIAFANVYLLNNADFDDKLHLVEINRAYTDIRNNGFNDDVSNYQYITAISLDSDFNDNEAYVLRIYEDGYIKFNYSYKASNNILIVNLILIAFASVVLAILVYVKMRIINPFNRVSELPYELSKGHLTKSLEEEKSRFFGKFIWGLDMLRETLEQRKANELMLQKEKKMLVLSISHDIKTPLSAIKLYTKAMSEGLGNSDELAYKIDQNADKIESFVNDIIKTSKEDFLNIEVVNSEFYLVDLLDRINDYYCDKLELLKIDFLLGEYENCLIYGDIERTVEAFENIIENAIKYGDGKEIELSITREEACLLVTVTNSGNTLSDEEAVHVFDSFWRGSNAKDKKGSGLGLYICRRILTQMNGDIFIETNGDNMNVTAVLKIL